jgi:hypothetical protein
MLGGSWEEATAILNKMITGNVRDRQRPEVMDDMTYYLRVLDLDPDKLSVIHVAVRPPPHLLLLGSSARGKSLAKPISSASRRGLAGAAA